MTDTQHIIRIIAHVIQVLTAVVFLLLMWKWSRPKKKLEMPKEQAEAAERCVKLRNQIEKNHLESTLSIGYYK